MTQETRRGPFVDYQRFARLVSQEAHDPPEPSWEAAIKMSDCWLVMNHDEVSLWLKGQRK
jgi:hypothetical protein